MGTFKLWNRDANFSESTSDRIKFKRILTIEYSELASNHWQTFTCLKMVSANCFDITGAASAGLPGLTRGEHIGGMWNSIAAYRINCNVIGHKLRTKHMTLKGEDRTKMIIRLPRLPSSGDSVEGVIISILIAASIVCRRTWIYLEKYMKGLLLKNNKSKSDWWLTVQPIFHDKN